MVEPLLNKHNLVNQLGIEVLLMWFVVFTYCIKHISCIFYFAKKTNLSEFWPIMTQFIHFIINLRLGSSLTIKLCHYSSELWQLMQLYIISGYNIINGFYNAFIDTCNILWFNFLRHSFYTACSRAFDLMLTLIFESLRYLIPCNNLCEGINQVYCLIKCFF